MRRMVGDLLCAAMLVGVLVLTGCSGGEDVVKSTSERVEAERAETAENDEEETSEASASVEVDSLEGDESWGSDAVDPEEAKDILKITDSGWSAESGLVQYGLVIKNTSKDLWVDYPQITITGRAKDGSILFSDTEILGAIAPNGSIHVGNMAGNGTAPATVEFEPVNPDEWTVRKGEPVKAQFSISNVSVVDLGYGMANVTGEVTTLDDEERTDMSSDVRLNLILRNSDGEIVYGSTAFVPRPDLNESTSFEIPCLDLPEFEKAEVYAVGW